MIKAIIFDIDGVLLDSFEANLKFFSDLMTNFGYNPPNKEQFVELFHRPMKHVIEIFTKADEKKVEKIWQAGKDKEIPYAHELLRTPEYLEITISALNKKYTLGIVTGRVRESVYSIVQLANLKQYFKVVVAFQDTENHKPHPEPLLLAARKLGVKPEECVYIGDVENDIKAARAAGMKIIIYSKNRFNQADACTSSFIKLPKLISSLVETNT